MKISEIIISTDNLRAGNSYSLEQKLKWLSELDGKVNTILYKPFGKGVEFIPYSADEMEREALIPFPFCEGIYTTWLCAKIDLANGEQNYFTTQATFNSLYSDFEKWVLRNNKSNVKFKY